MLKESPAGAGEVSSQPNDIYKKSRVLYVLECAFEYFVNTLVTGAYLAKITKELGISDGLTGILTSFVSLGYVFQLFAIFLANKRPVKRWVITLHTCYQALFLFMYLLPLFDMSAGMRTVLFSVLLLSGHAINNLVNSSKLNWFMSLVDGDKRGRYTSTVEIVSLIGGMLFSFVLSAGFDYFDGIGKGNAKFVYCSILVTVLMILDTCMMLFSKEKPMQSEKIPVAQSLKRLGKNKTFLSVLAVSGLWNAALYATTPFYGTYQITELGFSMLFVSALSVMYSVVRALAERPLGRYADKHSFVDAMRICLVFFLAAFAVNCFTVPQNGKIFYTAYYFLFSIGNGAANSCEYNLVFDNVDECDRVPALMLRAAFAGMSGFISSLVASTLVTLIQSYGDAVRLFGYRIYAQQIVSAIGVVIVIIDLIYIKSHRGCFAVRSEKIET